MSKITKKIEATGEVCVKFTEEEMTSLRISPGEKFSVELSEDGEAITLTRFCSLDLDMETWPRPLLEQLIVDSCEKDISVNEVITQILENKLKDN